MKIDLVRAARATPGQAAGTVDFPALSRCSHHPRSPPRRLERRRAPSALFSDRCRGRPPCCTVVALLPPRDSLDHPLQPPKGSAPPARTAHQTPAGGQGKSAGASPLPHCRYRHRHHLHRPPAGAPGHPLLSPPRTGPPTISRRENPLRTPPIGQEGLVNGSNRV